MRLVDDVASPLGQFLKSFGVTLLRLAQPLEGPVALALQAADSVTYADTGVGYDDDRANHIVPLGVAPPSFAASVPVLDRAWAAVLAAGLFALAAIVLARRRAR